MTVQDAFAAALLDASQPVPVGLRTWNGSDPATRFAVYRNNVMVSLVDALADSFPVTLELVGEMFFRAMAQAFVQEHPPRTRVLNTFGVAFPDFIESFAPAESVAYLADVSRLEFLRVRSYHSPDADPIDAPTLAALLSDQDSLPGLELRFHPSTYVIHSRYAIFSIWAAHQGQMDLESIEPSLGESALIFRNGLDVETQFLPAGASQFLRLMLARGNIQQAAISVSELHPEFDLAAIMALLLRNQLVTSMHHSSRRT